MDINGYKQRAPTAGISIFHDGLPKLASVHCYDRGNIATFGLQSCISKPLKQPTECFPIRPIANHIKPGVLLANQHCMYSTQLKRPQTNQSKIYTGAFYPPGSQPRLQFVDGRPIIIPSTFNNKFIPRQSFNPSVNKTKSVVYNDPLGYSNCCKQHAIVDDPRKYKTVGHNGSNIPGSYIPTSSYNPTYVMENEAMRRSSQNEAMRRSNESEAMRRSSENELMRRSSENEAMRRINVNEAIRRSSENEAMRRSSETEAMRQSSENEAMRRSSETEAMRQSSENEAMRRSSENEAMRRSSENEAMRRPMNNHDYNGTIGTIVHSDTLQHPEKMNVGLHKPVNTRLAVNPKKKPVIIDLEEDNEKEKESYNKANANEDFEHNAASRLDRNGFPNESSEHRRASVTNSETAFRCNFCQQELTLENSHTYIDDSAKTSSGYNFTSTMLCNACVKKNRMWDSMRNVTPESNQPRVYNTSPNYQRPHMDISSLNSSPNYEHPRMNNSSRDATETRRDYLRNKSSESGSAPIVIDLEEPDKTANDKYGNSYNNNTKTQTPSIQERSSISSLEGNQENYPNDTVTPRETSICRYCNKNALNDAQLSESCLNCVRSWRRSVKTSVYSASNGNHNNTDISPRHFNTNRDIDEPPRPNILVTTPVVIDLEGTCPGAGNKSKITSENSCVNTTGENDATAFKSVNEITRTSLNIDDNFAEIAPEVSPLSISPSLNREVIVKSEADSGADADAIVLHMEGNNNRDDGSNKNETSDSKTRSSSDVLLELEIDETSFESFINNRTETDSPPATNNSSGITTGNSAVPDYITTTSVEPVFHQSEVNESSRKRKSIDTANANTHVSHHGNKGDTLSPPPPFQLNKEQLQKLRNKVIPVLKAKKWIRESSTETYQSCESPTFD